MNEEKTTEQKELEAGKTFKALLYYFLLYVSFFYFARSNFSYAEERDAFTYGFLLCIVGDSIISKICYFFFGVTR